VLKLRQYFFRQVKRDGSLSDAGRADDAQQPAISQLLLHRLKRLGPSNQPGQLCRKVVHLRRRRPVEGRALIVEHLDGSDETVSTSRAVYDVLIGRIVLAEGAPKRRHLDGKICFDDEGIRPGDLDEFALAHQFPRTLDERDQDFDSLAAEANHAVAFEQDPLGG